MIKIKNFYHPSIINENNQELEMPQTVKGTRDIFGNEVTYFQHVEDMAKQIFHRYGYSEIRTPILEDIATFRRSIGTSSDIIHKEMYDFVDKGGRHISMRPENTAGVIRAIIQHKLLINNDPKFLYYIGPMFRYERMQTGRFRQFWQIGTESIAVSNAESEAESMLMLYEFLSNLGLKDIEFLINSVGTPEDRLLFYDALKSFFATKQDLFCKECHRRILENPMRILDCKYSSCQNALDGHPLILDYLNTSSIQHHESLKSILKALGLPFKENPKLVRGLDYYTNTVFEVISNNLGAQSAILGGGRYNNLIQQLGGSPTPAFGWSVGLDRLVMLLQQQNINNLSRVPIILIPLSQEASIKAMKLACIWRQNGLEIQLDSRLIGIKKSLSTANRLKAKIVLILGNDELNKNMITVKYLDTGIQETWNINSVRSKLNLMI